MNIVEPPDKTTFENKSDLISISHFYIELYNNLWIESISLAFISGLNNNSGHLNKATLTLITVPSGKVYSLVNSGAV